MSASGRGDSTMEATALSSFQPDCIDGEYGREKIYSGEPYNWPVSIYKV
jgi:hypothetical protein